MQLEVRRGFSLLELIVVMALLGFLYFAFSGIIFRSRNQEEQWLERSLDSLVSLGADQASRYESPYRILLQKTDSKLFIFLQRLEADEWMDVQVLKCPQGISIYADLCLGATLLDGDLAFQVSSTGMDSGSQVAFLIYERSYEYLF